MTTIKRTKPTLSDPVAMFKQFIVLKAQGEQVIARASKIKDDIKAWLPEADGVYENEKGSKFVDFDETLKIGGQPFKGMELRKSQGQSFDEDEAEKICKRRKIDPFEYTTTVVTVDQDKILRLQAQGLLTDKDMDKIITDNAPSWAFWPVKGEVL